MTRAIYRTIAALVLFLALAVSAPAQTLIATEPYTGRIIAVQDADTITVQIGMETVRIRLYGIDAPESDQPHGAAATRYVRRHWLLRSVIVEPVEQGPYGRTIAQVYRNADNISRTPLSRELVTLGHAWHYVQFAPENTLFESAERAARKSNHGLWKNPDPVPPWEWRRGQR